MKTKFSPRILFASLLVALASAGAVFAMNGERCAYGGGRMEQRMAHGMKAMSRLHDELKLDASQQALWRQAEQASKAAIADMREQVRTQGEEALAAVSQPGADLRVVMQRMEKLREAGRQQHEAVRDHWLAVYDALDASQKEQAREFFKSKLERMARWRGFAPGGAAGG